MTLSVPNRGPELLRIDVAFAITATIAVLMRCYVRLFMVKAFGIDDWLMSFSVLSFICYCSFSAVGVHYGTGHHSWDLTTENNQTAKKCWWFCFLFYAVTMISSKLSIGFFLLRITVKKIHTWILYAAMFVSVLAGMVFFFVCAFQCHPVSMFWKDEPGGSCINIKVVIGLAYLYGGFSVISDFTFAILPGFLIWDLQVKRTAKAVLIPLLAMGCIASSAVVVRFAFLHMFTDPDFLWATVDIAIWSTVEQGLAVAAGSFATLRPLMQIVMKELGTVTSTYRRRPSAYGLSGSLPLSRRKGSKGNFDGWTLSDLSSPSKADAQRDEGVLSPNTRSMKFEKTIQSIGLSNTKIKGDNESEEELSPRMPNRGSGDQIVVTKSFYIADDKC
ncbi:hypothetical protein K491DRAFT_684585 [Lophiostoma macrostomum CBS 122681]|uniref:Rhodopsin domain-containing protein n=1 Tax=Lophiostoma macrostomum CBS 122681 TaxID=1314788 RepID=A0A6A6SLV1_9PLEO|nr:hypothetical protein K491DRAFT_684585 [Lophiostoma macrostomum CBS 122681]